MYVEIKENKLLSWCENPYLDYEFIDIDYSTFDPEKYVVKNNKLISNPNYESEQEQKQALIQAKKNITKRQLLIWLFTKENKTEDDILSAINTIPNENQKYLAKINYNGTSNFYYGNKFVSVIGSALGLTENDIKIMFDEAVEL